jgi:hypothetical protein
MKKAMIFSVLIISTAMAAPPRQEPIEVALGPKAYRDGDVIEITEVTATSARLEQGDSVTVRGRVRLDSRSSARLCLFLTQTEGDGLEETDAGQSQEIARGMETFELKTTIKHRGLLHVTLYDARSGKPFGGTYFGTADQMRSIAGWNVGYYLAD